MKLNDVVIVTEVRHSQYNQVGKITRIDEGSRPYVVEFFYTEDVVDVFSIQYFESYEIQVIWAGPDVKVGNGSTE